MCKKIKIEHSLIDRITNAYTEKDVEIPWIEIVNQLFKNSKHSTLYKTDGVLNNKSLNLNILFEFKKDLDFSKLKNRCTVIMQSIFYLKQMELNGETLPTIVFIANNKDYFYFHINWIESFLVDKDMYSHIDFSSSASKAASVREYSDLFQDIEMLEELHENYSVMNLSHETNFEELKEKVIYLNENSISLRTDISPRNFSKAFDNFTSSVINYKDKTIKSLNSNDIASIFIDCIINRDENYLHPNKKNVLITSQFGHIKVDSVNFKSYFSQFEGQKYTKKQKQELVAIKDRLIEDDFRKRKGEFFTPTAWVDEGHKMISENFGEDWKEKYFVWDCACGTMNLTRDYKFANLFSSTLEQSDIDTSIQMKNNKEAQARFAYDFLNQDLDDLEKIPNADLLLRAFEEDKPIIFFINPPYGTANNMDTKEGSHKKGVAYTQINKLMKEEKWGAASQQLYAQFLYRICKIKEKYNLSNINICLFSPPLFLGGNSYKSFRKNFIKEFKYFGGYLMDAKHFADVSSWGLTFSMFGNNAFCHNDFKFKIKDIVDGKITHINDKIIYNTDIVKDCSSWVKIKSKKIKDIIDLPQLKSGLNIHETGSRGTNVKGGIGYYYCNSNNVMKNNQSVALYSSSNSAGNGIPILRENINEIFAFFTARRTVSGTNANWINWYDEYLKPSYEILNSDEYKKWNKDSIIYALFESKSVQSSLREISYKNKRCHIFNEFFFMSKEEMRELAEEHTYNDLEEDLDDFGDKDRYVYELLEKTELSDDATEVLEFARSIVRKTFPLREEINDSYQPVKSTDPEDLHLNCWDAGWYQIKKLINESKDPVLEDMLKEFNKKYKAFEDRMREGVYKFGFLK